MKCSDETFDLSEYFPEAVKAEGRGHDILILYKLKEPWIGFDGTKCHFEMEYRWLSDCVENDPEGAGVKGSEVTYATKKEVNGYKDESLFELFRLFP